MSTATDSGPFYDFESLDLLKQAIEAEQAICFEPDDIINQAGMSMSNFQDDSAPEIPTELILEGFKVLKKWDALDVVKRYYNGWANHGDEVTSIFGKLVDAGAQ